MYTNEYQMYNYINFYNDGRINKLKQKTKNPQKFYVFVIRKRLARVTHIYYLLAVATNRNAQS